LAETKELNVTSRLVYFSNTVLEALSYTQRLVDFIIEKGKLYNRIKGQLSQRQEKALNTMFQFGPDGFEFGLNAEKYISITGTSRATATRDLQDLVDKGIFTRSGELKSTRYHLNLGENKRMFLS
jgi:Fic family protein